MGYSWSTAFGFYGRVRGGGEGLGEREGGQDESDEVIVSIAAVFSGPFAS